MRRLLFSLLMFCVMPAWADGHDQLYKVAGWPEQRAHFNDALSAAEMYVQLTDMQARGSTIAREQRDVASAGIAH